MNDIRFICRKLDGRLDLALGTDSVVPATLHNSLPTIHRIALQQARQLRYVQPNYLGYSIRGLKPVLFTKSELELIHN